MHVGSLAHQIAIRLLRLSETNIRDPRSYPDDIPPRTTVNGLSFAILQWFQRLPCFITGQTYILCRDFLVVLGGDGRFS
jgi:hypothetical protein